MSARAAKDCQDMSEVRAEIDRIDLELVDLIAERFSYVDRAWQLKSNPQDAYVPWRIQQVIDKVKGHAKDKGLPLMQALGNTKMGLPFTVAVDRNGKLVHVKLGAIRADELTAAAEAALK